jgi:hypothetical protein
MGGKSIIVPGRFIKPFKSQDEFSSHGTFVYAGFRLNLVNGNYFIFVEWELKSTLLVAYLYCDLPYELGLPIWNAFYFGIPYGGLTGGQIYNVIIRPQLFDII